MMSQGVSPDDLPPKSIGKACMKEFRTLLLAARIKNREDVLKRLSVCVQNKSSQACRTIQHKFEHFDEESVQKCEGATGKMLCRYTENVLDDVRSKSICLSNACREDVECMQDQMNFKMCHATE